jgi:4-alpha-glucanotransferase
MHLTSLPGDHGIGEIGRSALSFVDTLASMHVAVWQFLPIGPTAYGDSPYQPLSIFAGNEMLIDIESLVRLGLLDVRDATPLRELPHREVDYGRLIPAKHAILTRAAENFASRANAALESDFDHFLEQNDEAWLHDYALFRVLKSRHGGRPWPEWDRPYRQRRQDSMTKLENEAVDDIWAIKLLQFLFSRQWSMLHAYATEHGVTMFGDMPFYVALDSADAWAQSENLLIDRDGRQKRGAGVPPDYFNRNGQLWGNPLYDWRYQSDRGFDWWVSRLRHCISRHDLVKIDHFRGFESFWSVSTRFKTARCGRWEPGPGEALFDALQSELGNLPLVAEDLGLITPAVDALRNCYGFPGMKVLQFEVARKGFDIADIEENCVCYTGTHDNDTTVGWFVGSPTDRRSKRTIARTQKLALDLTGGTPETIHYDMIGLALSSNARLAVAPMQDYLGLGSHARLNTPGTTANNWRWRLQPEQLTPRLADFVKQAISANDRQPSKKLAI